MSKPETKFAGLTLFVSLLSIAAVGCTQSSSSETEARSPDKSTSPQVVTSQAGNTNISASDQLELKVKNESSQIVITINGYKATIITLGDGSVTIKLPAEVLAAIRAATSESVALDIQVYASESDFASKSNASAATVSVSKSSAAPAPTPTNTALPAATATPSAGSISTLTSNPASASIKVRGTSSLVLTAGYSDGTSAVVTSSSSCVSSNTAVATISSGIVTGKKVGSATVTCLKSGVSKDIAVTVAAANMIIQWGGWQKSGYGLYDSAGSLLSTLVNDSPTLDRRGMFAVSGGFYSVGFNPNNSTQISEYFNNDGTSNGSHAILQNGAWMSGPQAITTANDGRFLVPQSSSNAVEVFAADGSQVAR